jgi:hypothetical protein
VLDLEVRYFLHPAAGVIEHQQERAIAQGEAALGRQPMKERRDLVCVEKAGFRWRDTFARNRSHLLGHDKALRHSSTQKLKERMQDRQPLIARPSMIVACIFEILEETQDPVERERIEGDLCESTGYIGDDEAQKEPQNVPVRLDGGRS